MRWLRELGDTVTSDESASAAVRDGAVTRILDAASASPTNRATATYALQSIAYFTPGRAAIQADTRAVSFASASLEHASDNADDTPLVRQALNLAGNAAIGCASTAYRLARGGAIRSIALLLCDADPAEARLACWAATMICTAAPPLYPTLGRTLTPPAIFAIAAASLPESPEDTPGATDAGNLLDHLVNEEAVSPSAFLLLPDGQGVGVLLQLLEDGVPPATHAAKVCLLAMSSEEEGAAAAASLEPTPDLAAALLALAPHSRRMAEVLCESVPLLVLLDAEIAEEFLEIVPPGDDTAECAGDDDDNTPAAKRQRGGDDKKTKKKGKKKGDEAGSITPLAAKVRSALGTLLASAPRGSPGWHDVCGGLIPLRTEAGYALSSSRRGSVVFSKPSAAGFGPVTVVRHGSWNCLKFGEVEQGLTYVGSLGEAGFCGGRAIPGALGYDYIRTMAAALMHYGGAGVGDSSSSSSAPHVISVGLGSGALPAFAGGVLGCRVTVFEIDSVVIEAASAMGFDPTPTLTVENADACAGMSRLGKGTASAVLLDAYDTVGGIPGHLREKDFLEQVGRVLSPGGVAIANLHNGPIGSRDRALAKEYITLLRSHVGETFVVKLPTQQSNLVAVAFRAESMSLKEAVAAGGVGYRTGAGAGAAPADLEFSPEELLVHTFRFSEAPLAEDGLPAALWGSAAAECAEGKEDGEEEEEGKDVKGEDAPKDPEASAPRKGGDKSGGKKKRKRGTR